MLKKVFITVLAISVLLIQPMRVCALEPVSIEPIIVEQEKHETIQHLIDLRCELCAYSDVDEEEIRKIDEQLRTLGVEELSAQDMAQKLGYPEVSVMVTPADKAGVTYLSERFVTVWNGQRYEIQVVTASPKVGVSHSPLKVIDALVFRSISVAQAIKTVLLEVLVNGAFDVTSEFGPEKISTAANIISSTITAYDIYSRIIEEMSPEIYIGDIEQVAVLNVSFYERYVFVKYEGSIDTGNQILAYSGNKSTYTITIVDPNDVLVNGESVPINDTISITETYRAQYYENYIPRVAQIFWNYKNNGDTNFVQKFWIYRLSLKPIGSSEYIITAPEVGAVWS